jgi:hypothetical protein
MRRMAITLVGAAALTIGGGLFWGADAQIERGAAALAEPAQNFTRSKRPPAVLIGAGFAARGITESAAAIIAGAPLAECENAAPASLATALRQKHYVIMMNFGMRSD